MSEDAYIPPRLTLRVGVTGHRPNKLQGADLDLLQGRVSEVLAFLSEVVASLYSRNNELGYQAPFAEDKPHLRLATALAEGGDTIATRAATEKGYDLNVILPFPQAVYEQKQEFKGEALEEFRRFFDGARTRTELNPDSLIADDEAYLSAGLLTLAHSDVLIAIWDEKPADGIGGTAQVVDQARMRGLLTILITPDGNICLWDYPETGLDPIEDGTWMPLSLESGRHDSPHKLAIKVEKILAPRGLARNEDNTPFGELDEGLRRFRQEKVHPYTWASVYNLLRSLFLGEVKHSFKVDNGLAREREQAWQGTRELAETIGGEGFQNQIDNKLRERWIGSDNLAVHFSHVFRSAVIANFILAAAAVLVGLLTVFLWDSKSWKAAFVVVELILIGLILWTTRLGHRRNWRDRWLDYRSLAEALRPARLPLLMGGSPLRPAAAVGHPPGQWVAWYVQASLREIEPPTASIGTNELRNILEVALEEEITNQIAYHSKNRNRSERLDHRLEVAALWALVLTVVSGVVYLLAFLLYELDYKSAAEFYKPLATFLGGVLPVLGAAIFGIRATIDFRSAARQSERMVAELESLQSVVSAHLEAPRRNEVNQLFVQISRTLSEDLRIWGMIYSGRELSPGF